MSQQRRFMSYAFFILAVIAFIVLAPLVGNWTLGIAVALMGIIAGLIFYRRGK